MTTQIVYKGRNAPFKARITDFDGTAYTAARMALITRMELRYRPTSGATVEPVDSAVVENADCFDWATYAADADAVIDLGSLDLTVGRDTEAELIVYDTAYPDGRVVGTLLDILVSAETQDAGALISILYPKTPLTVTDDYQVLLADFNRPSVRVNASTLKTMTMPAMTADYNGSRITFIIMGTGDIDIVASSGEDTTFGNETSTKLTGTEQYSAITLEYDSDLDMFVVIDGTMSWRGGMV